jgi:hypothetical protein
LTRHNKEIDMTRHTLRIWLVLTALAGCAGATAAARAAPDGCEILRRTVLRTALVTADGTGAIPALRSRPGQILVCHYTAMAVTRGFAEALTYSNVYVDWQTPDRERGDLCLSGNLAQCYPAGRPGVPVSPGDAAWVADSWYALLHALEPLMPGGFGKDVTRFTRDGLEVGLRQELTRTLQGRSYQEYGVR